MNSKRVSRVVLAGGGHSHAIVARMVGMRRLPRAHITLVSDVALTPYSGMLPGLIAGRYTSEDAHIDLRHVCQFAGIRFVRGEVIGLDPQQKLIRVRNRPDIPFDLLSINIGSSPSVDNIEGAREFAIPIKPVAAFLRAWQQLLAVESADNKHIAIVGGGAGGVELALCMSHVLGSSSRLYVFQKDPSILPTHNRRVRRELLRTLQAKNIAVKVADPVVKIDADRVTCASGEQYPSVMTILTTDASSPTWLKESDLATDNKGFILIDSFLRSISHKEVFAVGDIASNAELPRPKSGVYAVRQGKPLYHNLRATMSGSRLRPYRSQKRFLSLIGTGDGQAIASKGIFTHRSKGMWRLKDWIDTRFIQRFANLQPMVMGEPGEMRCFGCAAKLAPTDLRVVMDDAKRRQPGVFTGRDVAIGAGDDSSVLTLQKATNLVQSVDFFPSFVDDTYVFGKIATLHGFNDILAMGATPHSALVTLVVPFSDQSLMRDIAQSMLSGCVDTLADMRAALIGGHTGEGPDTAIGILANGTVDHVFDKRNLQGNEVLILTKPLGTGVLFAGQMRNLARGAWIDGALDSMLKPQWHLLPILRRFGVSACTDISGFGLAGHLLHMLRAGSRSARIELEDVPILAGAMDLIAQGVRSSLHSANIAYSDNIDGYRANSRFDVLFDPQTSGGLLFGVRAKDYRECLRQVRETGLYAAARIGEVLEEPHVNKDEVRIHLS